MRGVHEVAAVGFDASAEAYERGRPGYPREAVDAMARELRIGPGAAVLELAAGTGKFTRLLVGTGARIVAVEPVEGMRREFVRLVPGVPVLAGTAEAVPLRDGSMDAAVVAQAFHWFDGAAALSELHRVLRPSCRLGVVWNVRDEGSPLTVELTELLDRYRYGVPQHRDLRWRAVFEETTLFTSLESASFPFEQRLTREGYLDRAMSVSFMATLSGAEQARARDELLALIPVDAETVVLPYRTDLHWCERLDP